MISASVRNIGHRIARIFTRKKNRQLEGSKTSNEPNQQPTTTHNLKNSKNDSSVTDDHFQRCTSYSLKAKNNSVSTDTAMLESTEKMLTNHSGIVSSEKVQTNMEQKPKDINQIYREMEESVAQKVRETMELADAKRRALAQATLLTSQKEITVNVYNSEGTEPEIIQTSRLLVTNTVSGAHVEEQLIDHLNKSVLETKPEALETTVQDKFDKQIQDLKNINERIEESDRITDVQDTSCLIKPNDTLQIGFEQFKDGHMQNYGLHQSETALLHLGSGAMYSAQNAVEVEQLQNAQIGFEQFNAGHSQNHGLLQSETTSQHLGSGALYSAQNAVEVEQLKDAQIPTHNESKTSNNSSENTLRHTEEPLLAQNTLRNNNNPFHTAEDTGEDLRRVGENALTIAETAVKNYSNNPFKIDDETKESYEKTQTTAQNISEKKVKNPFYINDDPIEISQLNFAKNPFELTEDDEEEIRDIGAGALNIAQEAAKKIESDKPQLSETAVNIHSVFNNLVGSKDLHKPLVQIGFDQFNSSQDQPSDTDDIAC